MVTGVINTMHNETIELGDKSEGKGTYGKVNAKNTNEQIKKRYVLNIKRYLPILRTDG
jgi:hypothetical protein